MTQLSLELDRSSHVPLYFQVARQIEMAIEKGDLVAGDKLENEIGLADRLGLSRPTMRRAIQELVAKGLLVRKRGVGTQVLHGQVKRQIELTSLYDDLKRLHQEPSTQVLTYAVVGAEDAIAEQLRLAPGTDVLHLERLRLTHGQPLAMMGNWLPADLATVLSPQKLATHGLYELIRASGIHMVVAKQRVGARAATSGEAKRMRLRRAAPLLTAERTTYDDRGNVVEYGRHIYRPDSYSIEFTLVDS